jgi:Holliday junction resolvase RusA-like endonuclease
MYNPSGMHQREFAKACESYLPLKPLEGPIEAKMIFYFDRPKYQFRTGKNSHLLKEGISNWHSTRKDLDNLIKFVLDSLNKKAYLDDSQVIAN